MSVHKSFLKKIEDFWFALSNEHEELFQRDMFIGKLGKSDLLNYFIILAKLHIWSSRHFAKSPNFDVFKEMVDIKYRTEKYIDSKNNTKRKFQAKWQLHLNIGRYIYT